MTSLWDFGSGSFLSSHSGGSGPVLSHMDCSHSLQTDLPPLVPPFTCTSTSLQAISLKRIFIKSLKCHFPMAKHLMAPHFPQNAAKPHQGPSWTYLLFFPCPLVDLSTHTFGGAWLPLFAWLAASLPYNSLNQLISSLTFLPLAPHALPLG